MNIVSELSQGKTRSWMVWSGASIALVGLVVVYAVAPADTRAQCLGTPCSYYENRVESPGRCGSRPDDPDNCYCFKQQPEAAPGTRADVPGKTPRLQAACEK